MFQVFKRNQFMGSMSFSLAEVIIIVFDLFLAVHARGVTNRVPRRALFSALVFAGMRISTSCRCYGGALGVAPACMATHHDVVHTALHGWRLRSNFIVVGRLAHFLAYCLPPRLLTPYAGSCPRWVAVGFVFRSGTLRRRPRAGSSSWTRRKASSSTRSSCRSTMTSTSI